MEIRIIESHNPPDADQLLYSNVSIIAIDHETGELIKKLDVSAYDINDEKMRNAYMPTFIQQLKGEGYTDIINENEFKIGGI